MIHGIEHFSLIAFFPRTPASRHVPNLLGVEGRPAHTCALSPAATTGTHTYTRSHTLPLTLTLTPTGCEVTHPPPKCRHVLWETSSCAQQVKQKQGMRCFLAYCTAALHYSRPLYTALHYTRPLCTALSLYSTTSQAKASVVYSSTQYEICLTTMLSRLCTRY
jgi:hypothetical protein